MAQRVYNADGTEIAPSIPGYALTSRTIIAQGTTSYTVPSGTRAIFVEAIGAGGAGGGGASVAVSASCGSGGGGGAYSAKLIVAPQLTAYTVSVGAGGVIGAAGNNPGSAGGDTTFDTTGASSPLAKGGAGGLGGGAGGTTPLFIAGVSGGAAASGAGDITFDGNGSGCSYVVTGLIGYGSGGAPGPWGGGVIDRVTQGSNTNPGLLYGAGGTGGCTLNGGAATQGSTGANGVLIVWELA